MPARSSPSSSGCEIADHLIRAFVADAHEDGGRCGERLVAVDILCERVHAGDGIAAKPHHQKADRGIPEADDRPGQSDAEEDDEKRSRRRCVAAQRSACEPREVQPSWRRPGMQILRGGARASARISAAPARRAVDRSGMLVLFPSSSGSGYSLAPNAKSKAESARPVLGRRDGGGALVFRAGARRNPRRAARRARPGRGPRARPL